MPNTNMLFASIFTGQLILLNDALISALHQFTLLDIIKAAVVTETVFDVESVENCLTFAATE